MPSENATCASCGVATTSPTAYTPSTLVRMLPSTDTKPRSSTFTPAASSPTPFGPRAAPDAHHHAVDRERLVLAVLALVAHDELGRAAVEAGDAHAGLHLDAALGERAHDRLRDLLVDAAEHLRERFEDRHLGADVDEERRELAADRAAADDRDAPRHPADLQDVVGGEHARAVELEAGRRRARAGPSRSR